MASFLIKKIKDSVLSEIKGRVAEGERLLEEAKQGYFTPDQDCWVSSFSVLVNLLDPERTGYKIGTLRSEWESAQWFQGNRPKSDAERVTVFAQQYGVAKSLLFGWVKVEVPEPVSGYGHLHMAAVGDGLCCGIFSGRPFFEGEGDSLVDWGTQPPTGPAIAGFLRLAHGYGVVSPHAFILTHYHLDHYNGLLQASLHPCFQGSWDGLGLVCAPGLPKIPQRDVLYRALMALNAYLMGNETGHYEYDLTLAIRRLAGHGNFRYRRLFRGDQFQLGPFRCVCGWPPRELKDAPLGKRVSRALEAFDSALREDPELQRLHEEISVWPIRVDRGVEERRHETEVERDERSILRRKKQLRSQREAPSITEFVREPSIWEDWAAWEWSRREAPSIPEPVQEANRLLREVANELGLAFMVADSVLVLGDLQGSRIRQIVELCEQLGCINFDILIAAHHGTAWDDALRRLRAKSTIVSSGRRLDEKFRKDYEAISETVLRTHRNGDFCATFSARDAAPRRRRRRTVGPGRM